MGGPGGNSVMRDRNRDTGDLNKLDGVVIHDGIPRPFFNQTWKLTFITALGSKSQDGFTFSTLCMGKDQGGTNGPAIPMVNAGAAPAGGGAAPQVAAGRAVRNRLLFWALVFGVSNQFPTVFIAFISLPNG